MLNKPFNQIILSLLLILSLDNPLASTQDSFKEENLMAVMVYNLTKFMQWPQEDTIKSFKIFVMKGSKIFEPLCNIAKKKNYKGKQILVKEIENYNISENCYVLVLSNEETLNLDNILSRAEKSNILVIGNKEGLAAKGVPINFIKVGEKIRFEINVASLKKSNLETSTQLLNLAVKIYGQK